MKKIFLGLFISAILISCDKNTIQQTSDSIKHADSLFTKANDGLKTLDSISKTINDSDGITKKVIIPEIQKQKKVIDSTIKSGGWKIDSINKEIEKITKNVVVGTDVVKTLDSANDALNNGENPIKVLTRTADQIFKKTKKQVSSSNSNSKSPQNNDANSQNENSTVIIPPTVEINPLVKNAKIEIEVEDLQAAKAILKQKIRENNADLVSENFSETEGFQREYVTVKVPLQNFDQLVGNVSSQVGNLKTKALESEGTDYVSGQLCDVEITLVQNDQLASNSTAKDDGQGTPDSFGSKSSQGFNKGFETLQNAFIALLPFWPFFVIGGIVLYFVTRNKKRKMLAEKTETEKKAEIFNAEYIPAENEKVIDEQRPISEEPDYSKYQPKK